MKNIKKVLLVSLLFISVLVLTGCSSKNPITAENFKNIMEGKGYKITDATSQFSNYDYVKKVYVARNSEDTYQIEFYEISDEEHTKSVYNNNKNIFESNLGNVVKGKVDIELKNNQKFRATSNGYFMALTRKNNTMIYVKVPASYSNVVSNVLKELGY